MIFLGLLWGTPEAFSRAPLDAKGLFKEAEQRRKALSTSKSQKKYRHRWMECIDLYLKVAKLQPKGEEAPLALYRAAQMYEGVYKYSGLQKDVDEAISLYRRVANDYKDHNLADDSQYHIGRILYEVKNDPSQAYVEFLKVDIKYPAGDMRPRAKEMLDRLTGILSKKDEAKEIKEEPSSKSGLARVQAIRHWSTPTYTRIVVDLERPVKFEAHLLKEDPDLKKPRRLYVDLKDTYVSSDIVSAISIQDGLLQGARAARFTKETVRVVLDINSIGGYKIFPLHDPFRVVVDVRSVEGKEPKEVKEAPEVKEVPEAKEVRETARAKETKPAEEVKEVREPKEPREAEEAKEPKEKEEREKKVARKDRRAERGIKKPQKPDETVTLARQLGLTVKRIVIDAGHGGKDPGCFLNEGVKEKDMVLEIAKVLAQKIRERLRCETILTRDKDVFLPLDERTAFANTQKADLFVSLHINAHKQHNIHGLETYFLNMATDEQAVMVAARENATSEKNISDLQKILNDLMLNTKISESSKLAYHVHKGMVGNVRKKYAKVKDLGVKQAPFYVLIGAEMPAVLVETGFITNSMERERLLSKKYMDTLSDGIVAGIDRYMKSINAASRGGG